MRLKAGDLHFPMVVTESRVDLVEMLGRRQRSEQSVFKKTI